MVKKIDKLTTDFVPDPELTRIAVEYIEAVTEIHRCSECHQMRYMRDCYFCLNPDYPKDK